uniref:Uncharacterized protein n=1 Tax=Arundo donax TaxID=35708 RepID=A0A0A8XYL2_ARUDO
MPYMKASERYCIRMPNKWNFSVDYLLLCICSFNRSLYSRISILVPLWLYMLTRRKVLSKAKTT